MKKHFCVILFLLHGFCYQGLSQKKHLVEGVINKDAILADIDEYADIVAKKHVHPFNSIKKKEFYDKIQQLKDSSGRLNIDQLIVRWLQINALVRDEHTSIGYEQIVRDNFPFMCYWFEEGIYITGTTSENTAYLHSRIIAINDVPLDEVVTRIATMVPDTNFAAIKYNIAAYLFDPFILHGLGITDRRDHAVFTVINTKNDTVLITPAMTDKRDLVSMRDLGRVSFNYCKVKGPYGFKFIDSAKTVYFRYSTCTDDKKYPFGKMIEHLEEVIDKRHPKKIIIDLRSNGGGHPHLLEPFVDYLNRSELNKKGSIDVLIGRRTFSAAILNAIYLKNQTHATLVGELTSGSVAHYGYVKFEPLPVTRMKMMYSTAYVENNEKYTGSLRPDVDIPVTFSDYAQGVDAAVDYALTH